MIATITLNPALDRSIYVDKLLPNDTNRILKVETDIGGKGINASRVLREIGSETMCLGFIGGKTGRFIEHELRQDGIGTDFVRVTTETRTNIGIQESSGAPPTTLNEPGPTITDADLSELYGKVRVAASKSSMVVLGGSLPPGAPADIYHTLVGLVQAEGAQAILDADGEPMRLGMEAAPFMIKPNRAEVERLIGVEIKSLDDAVRAVNILKESGVKLVVISMGADGAVAGSDEGIWHAVPPKVEVVSTIGSGDSMVAGIAHIISGGGSLAEALQWGSAAGAATAMTDGTEICRIAGIDPLLNQVQIKKIG
jgi:1-phosphofructokinase